MKILIFKIGAIGDILMSTPFIRDLRENFSDAQIDFLVGESAAGAIEENNYINNVYTFDSNIFFKKNIIKVLKLIKTIKKEKYDIIFVLDKKWIFGLFALLCGIKNRYGFDREGEGLFLTKKLKYNNEEHEIIQYKNLLTLIGKEPSHLVNIDFTMKPFAFTLPERFACFVIGGGSNIGEDSKIRRYPIRQFNRIINMIEYPVVLVGGKEDKELGSKITRKNNIYNLIGATNLEETAYIMSKANVIICSDSGPMHIASAVNNNIISLFGITNPIRKAPLNIGAIALWKDKDIYYPEYEFRGKLPTDRKYFTELTPDNIVCKIIEIWNR